jgi:hypothetical protein
MSMLWDERASTQSTTLDGAGKCVNLSLEGPHTSTHTCHSPYFAGLHSSSSSLEATHKNQSLDVKGVHLAPNFRQTETTPTAPFRGSLPSMLCYHTPFYMPCEGAIFLRFSLHGPTLSLSMKVVATRFRFATCRSLWFLSLTLCEAPCFSLWGICRLLAAFFFADTVSFSPSGDIPWGIHCIGALRYLIQAETVPRKELPYRAWLRQILPTTRPPAVLSGINVTQHVLMRRNKWMLPLPRVDRLPVDTYSAAYPGDT